MIKRSIGLLALLISSIVWAQDFVAGKDYEIITQTTTSRPKEKIKVIEFFSYGCPWCYRIEPALSAWLNQHKDKIQLIRTPVIFKNEWGLYAKAYYTAHLLGLDDKFNPILFKAIQEEGRPLGSKEAMIAFFTANGIDETTAKSAFENSTSVAMQLGQGAKLMSQARVNAVPALVINDQYKTDLQMAQGEKRLFEILDFLVNQTDSKNNTG